MWGPRLLILSFTLSFFGSTATVVPEPEESFKVHTIAVGQGDAHVIECETQTERDFAIVDMGTSSIKDARTVERIKKMVGKSVSNIFLTHPDEDHYNYLKNFQKFRKDKIHFHLGGNLALWDEGAMSRNVAFNEIIKPLIDDQSVSMKNVNEKNYRGYSEYTNDTFFKNENGKRVRNRISKEISLCNQKLNMEIFVGGYSSSPDKNEASLVMRLSGLNLKSMLFMGDFFDSNGIDFLLRDEFKNKLKSDVWILPHHGSEMRNLNVKSSKAQVEAKYKKLAKAVGAKKIVISSNIKGSYAHPRCATVKNLFYTSSTQCDTTPPPGIKKEYVQCWSNVEDQERLYRPEFCPWNDVEIWQTTREDQAGNVMWKDVVTDLKTGNVMWNVKN